MQRAAAWGLLRARPPRALLHSRARWRVLRWMRRLSGSWGSAQRSLNVSAGVTTHVAALLKTPSCLLDSFSRHRPATLTQKTKQVRN